MASGLVFLCESWVCERVSLCFSCLLLALFLLFVCFMQFDVLAYIIAQHSTYHIISYHISYHRDVKSKALTHSCFSHASKLWLSQLLWLWVRWSMVIGYILSTFKCSFHSCWNLLWRFMLRFSVLSHHLCVSDVEAKLLWFLLLWLEFCSQVLWVLLALLLQVVLAIIVMWTWGSACHSLQSVPRIVIRTAANLSSEILKECNVTRYCFKSRNMAVHCTRGKRDRWWIPGG